ncbi:MAG: cytochrome ubiquinol oxidase subunit I, partial [Caulobacterales bacterium]|nr:cytochrome ubiquinol oxidase subunit I [Caulobacterales bacterium]
FVVGAVGAFHLLHDRANAEARAMFSMAMWMTAIVAPLQVVAGDLHGLNTLEHQPVKVAAMEGHWERQRGAPLILFALPDQEAEENRWEIAIPGLSAYILTHHWDGETPGLKDVPAEDRPPVAIVFWSFRVMVGLGLLMVAVGLASLYLRWRGRLYDAPWLHRAAVAMGPSGFVAVLAGWITVEVGRQPFTVYGLLRTSESIAPVDAPAVAASLLAFIAVYFTVFGAGTWYILQMMAKPPGGVGPVPGTPIRAAGLTPAASVDPDRLGGDAPARGE